MANLLNIKNVGGSFELAFDDVGTKIFVPVSEIQTVGGTYTATRIADNDVVLRKTAAADTTYLVASLRKYFKTTAGRGAKVKTIDVVYSIGTAALTTHAATISTVTYANNTAVAVAAHGGTISGTLATATQANPYVSTLTLGTQSFAVGVLADVRLQVAVTAAATSAYDLYGLVITLDQTSL